MQNSEQNHSLHKAKIKFLLLEGIHPRAREVLESAGYTNIIEQTGALTPDGLHDDIPVLLEEIGIGTTQFSDF